MLCRIWVTEILYLSFATIFDTRHLDSRHGKTRSKKSQRQKGHFPLPRNIQMGDFAQVSHNKKKTGPACDSLHETKILWSRSNWSTLSLGWAPRCTSWSLVAAGHGVHAATSVSPAVRRRLWRKHPEPHPRSHHWELPQRNSKDWKEDDSRVILNIDILSMQWNISASQWQKPATGSLSLSHSRITVGQV